MTVDNSDVIDATGIENATGCTVLTIADHLEWSPLRDHLVLLQDKINRYIAFLENNEMAQSYRIIVTDDCRLEIAVPRKRSKIKLMPIFLTFGAVIVCRLASPVFGYEPSLEEKGVEASIVCKLSADAKTYHRGEKIRLTFLIESRRSEVICFNPFFQSRIRPPAELRVYNEGGEFVGDLLASSLSNDRDERGGDFISLEPDALVGVRRNFKALEFRSAHVHPQAIVPGVYRLQLCFNSSAFGATHQVFSHDDGVAQTAVVRLFKEVKQDVLRSNSIQIELRD